MVTVEKKCLPELFAKFVKGEKNCEFRLADFELVEGDTLILKEFDPRVQKFTGREIKKTCRHITRFNPLDYYPVNEIKKHSCFLIEFE